MDEGKEAGSEFIEASGNSSELLELEEEGFHKVTLLVEPPIDVPRIGIIFPRRDTEIRVVVGNELTKLPLAVGSVSENGRPLEVNLADQFLGDSNVRGINQIDSDQPMQMDMFGDWDARLKQQRLDDCIDQIRGRFGNRSIVAASLFDTLPIPDDDRDMVRMPGLMYA